MARPRRRPAADNFAVGHVRVSTEEQAVSGLGLAAQTAAIRAEAARRGLTLVAITADEGISGAAPLANRPGLSQAIEMLQAGKAGVLLVAKLDRATRSLAGLVELLALANRGGWQIVAIDMLIDTTTPMGRAMVHIAGVFAELERALASARTKDALAAKKAQGYRLGGPVTLPQATRDRVAELRGAGLTLWEVAAHLEAEGIPTARGGRWRPSTVAGVLSSLALDAEAEAIRAA
jgi:DNA invertase Pin-like site-specific DNA recombinase